MNPAFFSSRLRVVRTVTIASLHDVVPLDALRSELAARAVIAELIVASGVPDLVSAGVRPGIVLVDDSHPLDDVRRVTGELGASVLVICQEAREDLILDCLDAGASGLVERMAGVGVLAEAIATLASGRPWISERWWPVCADRSWVERHLSDKERQVLTLSVMRWTVASVARRMGVQEDTARTWQHRILYKYRRTGRPGGPAPR